MIQLIQTAALSENANRQEAEKMIVNLRQQNPSQFAKQVSAVFTNSEIPDHTRQAAGTILAVSFKHKNTTGNFVWDCLDPADKVSIKNQILGVLIDQSRNVRRSAANIIAGICFIQLPRNQWEGIVENICVNSNHENSIVKQSSILTLGFICQSMKERSDFIFPPALQENIMSGIIIGLQQNEVVLKQIAMKALKNSISSLTQVLANQNSRSFILNQIVNLVADSKFKVQALQILGEYCKSCYPTINHEMMKNLSIMLSPIVSRNSELEDQDACVAAMEVFETIAEYYRDEHQVQNIEKIITGEIGQNVVALLLNNLLIIQDSDNIDDNPISQSASKALQSIFDSGSSQYKQLVLNFVSAGMAKDNWKFQQASIKAFSLLLVGLTESQNQQLISTSFNELIKLLSHNSLHVQFATLDSLVIITQICGQNILKSDHFVEYLQLITSKVSFSEKFMYKGCKIIQNLCAAQKQLNLGKFNEIADKLIEFFLTLSLNGESSLSVVDWSVEAVMSIIEVMENEEVSLKYLKFALQNIDNVKMIGNLEKRQQLYSVFFTLIQFSLHTLRNYRQIQMQLLKVVYQKVVEYFQTIGDVTADGLYAVQALVPFFQGDLRLIQDFWQYIMHALNKWQDSTLLKSALSCIAFFTSSFGESLGTYLAQFLPNLMKLVQDQSFSRENKLDVIIFLGQIFLNCGKAALPYLEEYMNVIMLCCEASISLKQSDFQYSENLKDIIIESIKCVIHGLCDYPETRTIMQKYTESVFRFVQLTCVKQQNPTIKYLNQSLLLLGDYTKFYPQLTQKYKKSLFIYQCIQLLSGYNKNNQYNDTIRYAKMQFG